MNQDSTNRYMIPTHYAEILQPCDDGINKSLKERSKKEAANWRLKQHASLLAGDTICSPKLKDALEWIKKIWEKLPAEIAKNSFIGSVY